MSRGPGCDWEVFSATQVRDTDRQDVLGRCFGEPGQYGIRFELGIGELRPIWNKDLALQRLWRGYLTTEPIIIQVTRTRPSRSEPTPH